MNDSGLSASPANSDILYDLHNKCCYFSVTPSSI